MKDHTFSVPCMIITDFVMEARPFFESQIKIKDSSRYLLSKIPVLQQSAVGSSLVGEFSLWVIKDIFKVSLTTIAELYNEDDNTINHHGFTRKVGMEEEKVKIHYTSINFTIIWNNNSRLAQIIKWKRKYLKLLVGIIPNF